MGRDPFKGSLGQNGGGTLSETKGPTPILIRFALYRLGRDPFGPVETNTVSFLFNQKGPAPVCIMRNESKWGRDPSFHEGSRP